MLAKCVEPCLAYSECSEGISHHYDNNYCYDFTSILSHLFEPYINSNRKVVDP